LDSYVTNYQRLGQVIFVAGSTVLHVRYEVHDLVFSSPWFPKLNETGHVGRSVDNFKILGDLGSIHLCKKH
jgi:hypothetical protein